MYNFEKGIDRRNTHCIKWDYNQQIFGREDVLSMWVADMDLPVPPGVVQALEKRAEHPAFGYTVKPESLFEAMMAWIQKRHNWEVKKEWFAFSPGVVSAISIAIQALTNPGDKIIVQPPVYYPFFDVVKNNGRQLIYNPLKEKNGRYFMDFDDLQEKIDSRVKMILLCSPHNPVGRVWKKEELSQLAEICLKYNILIFSDEIHWDLAFKNHKHIPMASLSEDIANITLTGIAPSKTFNLAGLSMSFLIVPNQRLLQQINHTMEALFLRISNIFGIVATEAAYREGGEWLDALIFYIQENAKFVVDFCQKRIPKIKPVISQGTYLVWLDCRELGLDDDALKNIMIHQARVGLNDGLVFGLGGQGFQRINVACSRAILQEALERIEVAVKTL